ncbi:hypothetical protein Y1Q_0014191 [Alligator mississippiensis]|uniref:Uncharacterized protein n=1 Tax=Alligator mississippiensis TaxID=8496 RepID=A0A151MU74_ALLMI|nr:hypothetical protein Y1Q_0014191 [Alligator mississippiensis]
MLHAWSSESDLPPMSGNWYFCNDDPFIAKGEEIMYQPLYGTVLHKPICLAWKMKNGQPIEGNTFYFENGEVHQQFLQRSGVR